MRLHFIVQQNLTIVFQSNTKDPCVSELTNTSGWIFLNNGSFFSIGKFNAPELTKDQIYILRKAIEQTKQDIGEHGYSSMIIPEFDEISISKNQPN